jgi:plasmid replication initiation protein
MTLELSNWFWEGVLMKGGVLSIDRAYFDISGGRERWLYRVARKHAGGAGEAGFAIAMPTLFEKSGAEGEYRRFKFEIIKLADKNALPGYDLKIEGAKERKEPLLRMQRVDDKADAAHGAEQGGEPAKVTPRKFEAAPVHPPKAPDEKMLDASALIRSSVSTLSDNANRGYMTDDTIELLRRECPGWDLYTLHTEFERWIGADQARTPANWQRAFIGYVRRHHEKHKHELRG